MLSPARLNSLRNDAPGPEGHEGSALSPADASTDCLEAPAAVLRVNPLRRRYSRLSPAIVAPNRLLAATSLNQSLAVNEFLPLPVQALRTETVMLKMSAIAKGHGVQTRESA